MILYTSYFILFVFGLCVGSFLNAVIFRLEKGESIVFAGTKSLRKGLSPFSRMARSYCPRCKHTLAWYDLLPVLSFFMLRGKCGYCGKKISIQYPMVEIATGILFALVTNYQLPITNLQSIFQLPITNYQLLIPLIYYFYISSVLIVIFVYDLKHYIIPDKILFPTIGISILYHVSSIMQANNNASYIIHHTLYSHLGSAIIASGFFLSLVLVSRGRWMGLGDVKLAFLMGLVLGWPNILVALFLAFTLGAIVGLALILASRSSASFEEAELPKMAGQHYSFKSEIPFAPFLIIGTFMALFWGNQIVSWYLGMLF